MECKEIFRIKKMSQEPPHKIRKQHPAHTVYTHPHLASIITSFRRKNIICPMVLKVKTQFVEEVQHAIMLSDPPSQNATTWDDGKIGTSDGCKLTNLSLTQPTQYIVSMLKLTLKAAETIAAEASFNETQLSFCDLVRDLILIITIKNSKNRTKKFEVTIKNEGVHYPYNILEGKFTRNKDVVFWYEYSIPNIMDTFMKMCIGSLIKGGDLTVKFHDDFYRKRFEATMCIKYVRPDDPALTSDDPALTSDEALQASSSS
jgi:hypothetical protein